MAFGKKSNDAVVINAPNFRIVKIKIRGTSPLVSNSFSNKAQETMKAVQEQGSVDKAARGRSAKRPPKDFDAGFNGSLHMSTEGWYGFPVIGYRAGLVRVASLCGVEMTKVKMCVFVVADGYTESGKGLVRITGMMPRRFDDHVRLANGSTDICARGMFDPGWESVLTIQFDADFMSLQSIVNLVMRDGLQCGIGAGRPFSKESVGQGWGTFEVVTGEAEEVPGDKTDKAAE